MRRIGHWVIAVLLVSLLVACEDEPEPNFPTPSPTPTHSSPTTSPTPELETAEAFIRRWIQLSTAMQNTGDTAAFRAVSSKCEACIETADRVEEFYAAGGFVETDGWQINSLSCTSASSSVSTCSGRMLNTPTVYAESDSSPEQTLPGGPFLENFELEQTSSGWIMTRIAEQAS